MFEAVRNNPKIAQSILAALVLPFAFFGVDAYFRNGNVGGDAAAKVGKVEITDFQLEQAVREQENALRAQMGASFDPSLTNTPEFKAAVLDRMINEAAVKAAIRDSKLVVSNESIQEYIKQIPSFQENGHFSFPLYEAYVRNQGLTPAGFEQQIRDTVAQQQLMLPIAGGAVISKFSSQRMLALDGEKRSVSELIFDASSKLAGVKLGSDDAKKYYDAHSDAFRAPEQAKVEYVLLSLDDIARNANISEADARMWFDENSKALTSHEERRASHILVQVAADAKAEAREAARKKAEGLLAQVKASPARFAEIAKANSDDTGSAEKGGDLGFFGRGAMVKPFEDAAFGLKSHEISGLVETEFGYHIITVTDIRGEKPKTFEEMKAEAMEGARKQAANLKFSEISEQLGNMVYEQPDALKPVAEKFGLKLIQTDWTPRSSLPAVLQNQRVQTALFSSSSTQNRHNTEAIDLGNGSVISARIIDYKASAIRPFEEVRKQAEEAATQAEAARLAREEGESVLKKLQGGESVPANWGTPKELKRSSPELTVEARVAVFSAPVEKLPAYVGALVGNNYSIFRVEKAELPAVSDTAPELKDAANRQAMLAGQEDLRAYIEAIRKRQGVKLKAAKPKE
ncbi:SurA N-terminal domain-containing protein [Uliginosibacterium paludis]|uniref:Periplasmic chaperone PpiD n=1 Tax=Uliginosibacterium paludis TaxID=1615952 RepID=A0ABV2CV82_9RHOO